MRIWLISDLHLEHDRQPLRVLPDTLPEADVCVCAGDLTNGVAAAVDWLGRVVASRGMPVVFVPGNHEFYGSAVFEGLEAGRLAAERWPNVHLLDDRSVTVGGVRFVGATLWTDYALFGDKPEDMAWIMGAADRLMNDHRTILWRVLPQREAFTPSVARRLHQRSRSFLERELAAPFDGATVVVTHHAPHSGSVQPQWEDSPTTPAYASDLTAVIEAGRPDLWVHGHMHDACDYRVGDTRIVCNPRGYGNENARFDPGLIVEV
jgi:Icc-related predicted phosphoesterase